MSLLFKSYKPNCLAGCKGPAAEGLLTELLSISVILSISCMSVSSGDGRQQSFYQMTVVSQWIAMQSQCITMHSRTPSQQARCQKRITNGVLPLTCVHQRVDKNTWFVPASNFCV